MNVQFIIPMFVFVAFLFLLGVFVGAHILTKEDRKNIVNIGKDSRLTTSNLMERLKDDNCKISFPVKLNHETIFCVYSEDYNEVVRVTMKDISLEINTMLKTKDFVLK